MSPYGNEHLNWGEELCSSKHGRWKTKLRNAVKRCNKKKRRVKDKRALLRDLNS